MKRLLRKFLPVPVLAAGLSLSVGCTDEDTGMFILSNLALPAGSCSVRADATAASLGSGVLDVGLRLDYVASLLVANQLTPRGDKENLRTETMQVVMSGAEVRLFDDEGLLVEEFTVPASGVILPDPSTGPGLGIAVVTLIPPATGAALAEELTNPGQRRTLVAEAKVFGKTVGGLELESAAFTYVIRVCEGCLVNFPREALRQENDVLYCDQDAVDENDIPCLLGQDAPVDCRLCEGNAYCRPGGP